MRQTMNRLKNPRRSDRRDRAAFRAFIMATVGIIVIGALILVDRYLATGLASG